MEKSFLTKKSYAFYSKIVIVSCFMLLAFGCEIPGQSNVNREPLIVEKKPTAREKVVTADTDPAEAVRNAYKKFSTVSSYRMKSSDGDRNSLMEFTAPDRRHFVNLNKGWEMIDIGRVSYWKGANSKWKKVDDNEPLITDLQWFDKFIGPLAEILVVGPETLNGIPMMVYRHNKSTDGKRALTYKFWIGVRDNLLYKIEFEESKTSSKSKPPILKSTDEYYDYNADIKIEPPV